MFRDFSGEGCYVLGIVSLMEAAHRGVDAVRGIYEAVAVWRVTHGFSRGLTVRSLDKAVGLSVMLADAVFIIAF